MAHSPAAGGKANRLRDGRRLLQHGARERYREIHRGGHGKEEGLHRVRFREGADDACPPLLLPFGIFGDLRENQVPGFPRKFRREIHLEEQIGLPVAESDEEAVPRRRVSADKHPDPPLEDPLDPSIRQTAGPSPLEPHQHPVLGPRTGEEVPRNPHDGRLRVARNHDRTPLAREAQTSLDGPAPVRSPPVPRGAVRHAVTEGPSLPAPRRLLLPFPLHSVRIQRLQRGLEGAALALLHARLAVPVLYGRASLLERLRALPDPPFPIRLVAHPRTLLHVEILSPSYRQRSCLPARSPPPRDCA